MHPNAGSLPNALPSETGGPQIQEHSRPKIVPVHGTGIGYYAPKAPVRRECFLFPKAAPCFIVGGRNGDLIQLLPCWREIHRRIGIKPVVISSEEYKGVFDGVSYVTSHPVRAHWYMGVPDMRTIADALYGGGILPQFWHASPKADDTIGSRGRTWIVLQCHGHQHGVNMALDPDYGTSMARRCGFSRDEWLGLPLIFDKRDAHRESVLWSQVTGRDTRPVILYHFSGVSSPFGYHPEVQNAMVTEFGRDFNLIDLGKVWAHRIYDVLGLMDRARGMVLSDTYALHLSAASRTPYVGFLVDGWTSSVPKGNCVLSVHYNSTPVRLPEVINTMRSWRT